MIPQPLTIRSAASLMRCAFAVIIFALGSAASAAVTYQSIATTPTKVTPASGRPGTTFKSTGKQNQIYKIVFRQTGSRRPVKEWRVVGKLPSGLRANGGTVVSDTLTTTKTKQLTLFGTTGEGGRSTFRLYAIDTAGTKTFVTCTITILEPARITAQPVSVFAVTGETVTFGVTATGYPRPTYQWFKGSTKLAGKTSPTLKLTNVKTANKGDYTVLVTNSTRSIKSTKATLSVVASSGGGGAIVTAVQPPSTGGVILTRVPFTSAITNQAGTDAIFQALIPDQSYAYPLSETDGFTYSSIGLAPWMELDPQTGILSGTPDLDDVGLYVIWIYATDGTQTIGMRVEILVQ